MAQQPTSDTNKAPQQQADDEQRELPKTESSSEYEGAETRKPTGNPGEAVKTETSSSSGE